jgi:hypothetical protein
MPKFCADGDLRWHVFLCYRCKLYIMADNKNQRDARDRSRVAGNESYELSFLEEKMGVSREQVQRAIQAVGNDRRKVEEYLRTSNGSTDRRDPIL